MSNKKLYWRFYLCFYDPGCFSIASFTSLVGIPIWITSLAVGLRFFAMTSGIKNCKSIKHDKIVLLAKSKLYSIEVLISQALIDSVIIHDEFVLNNMLKEYNYMIEEIWKDLISPSDTAMQKFNK